MLESVEQTRAKAEQGDAEAQNNLGMMYAKGEGVAQDYFQAAEWYRKAAEDGNAVAQFNLGVMYANGQGVPRDGTQANAWSSKAFETYEKLAEQGDVNALAFLRKFAELGFTRVQLSLGSMYYNGQGVVQDYKEAAVWYRKAAEDGNATAQGYLSMMYDTGHGVPQDYILAYMFANIAATQEDNSATLLKLRGLRKSIGNKLTSSQIEEGQRLTREWLEKHPQAAQ